MAPAESPGPQPAGLLIPSLLMALGIAVTVFLTIAGLHFLVKRLYSRISPTLPSLSNQQCPRGVNKEVLESLPVQAYNNDQRFLRPDHRYECCVCLSVLEDGVLVRVLPACRHVFHCQCIDAWFVDHASCPFCRAKITAPESLVVSVDAMEGSDASVAENGQIRRSNTLASHSDHSRLMSFREKLRLKRCLSLESCNVR